MIFVYLYSRTTILFTYSIKGYIFGSVLLITSHVISIVFFDLGSGAQVTSAMYFSSIFGNSIYQAGISYSAVLSFFACTLIVIGCGSIGRRHAKIFYKLGIKNIIAVDTNPDRLKQIQEDCKITKTYNNIDKALN